MTTSEWRDLPTMPDVAAAQVAGEEIEVFALCEWEKWNGLVWFCSANYRARAPQSKKIKLLGWRHIDDGGVVVRLEGNDPTSSNWVRYPKLDDWVEE